MGKAEIYPVLMVPGMVLYPGLSVPIQIESDEVVAYIQDIMDRESGLVVTMAESVGMTFDRDSGLGKIQYAPRAVGVLAQPVELERMGVGPHGNNVYKLVVQGIKKVRIKGPMINGTLGSFQTETIHDHEVPIILNNLDLSKLADKFKMWMGQNVTDYKEREHFYSTLNGVEGVIDAMAFLMVQDRETRQSLLECDSLLERILIVNALFAGDINQESLELNKALKHFEVLEKLTGTGN